MTWLKKMWSDPVWSKVIAGVIIASGTAATLWIPGVLLSTKHLWFWITAEVSVSRWLFLFLIAYCIITLVLVFQAWLQSHAGGPEAPVTWRDYTKDKIYELIWTWQYCSIDDAIINLASFCPNCDYQLYGQLTYGSFRVLESLEYACPECHYTRSFKEEDVRNLENRVKRKVHQKIRNGGWAKGFQHQATKIT